MLGAFEVRIIRWLAFIVSWLYDVLDADTICCMHLCHQYIC